MLMQELHGGHLLAAFGDFDAVADQDPSAVDAQRVWQKAQHHPGPQRGERVEPYGTAMEAIEQLVIEARL